MDSNKISSLAEKVNSTSISRNDIVMKEININEQLREKLKDRYYVDYSPSYMDEKIKLNFFLGQNQFVITLQYKVEDETTKEEREERICLATLDKKDGNNVKQVIKKIETILDSRRKTKEINPIQVKNDIISLQELKCMLTPEGKKIIEIGKEDREDILRTTFIKEEIETLKEQGIDETLEQREKEHNYRIEKALTDDIKKFIIQGYTDIDIEQIESQEVVNTVRDVELYRIQKGLLYERFKKFEPVQNSDIQQVGIIYLNKIMRNYMENIPEKLYKEDIDKTIFYSIYLRARENYRENPKDLELLIKAITEERNKTYYEKYTNKHKVTEKQEKQEEQER